MTDYQKLYFLLLFIAVFMPINALCGEHDAIYMKDSSIVRGYIVEDVPDDYVKIQTIADTLTVISYDLIDHIVKENNSRHNVSKYGRSHRWIQDGILARSGFMFPNHGDPVLVMGMDLSRRILKNVSVGIGAEFDNYPFEDAFRFSCKFKMTPIKSDLSPLLIADFGYATCFDGPDSRFRNGGFSHAFGFGIQFWQLDKICLHLDMIYKTQHFADDIQQIDKYSEYIDGSHFNSWELTLGLSI